ncbi:hypothetical protein ACFOKI_11460 [Sphingomonas qilianensis]|uniref:Transposase n=1 Tax=Sphingomonas qilianensis TaxID=1736690 RepID=A0ABU9XP94_9SPHN
MRDDFLTSDWADHHHLVSRDIHKLVKRIIFGFKRLQARQFYAPWKKERRGRRGAH